MKTIEFQKNLIALEDLLIGTGTVSQTRGITPVTVTKINGANLPYDGVDTLADKIDDLQSQIDTLPEVVDQNGNMLTGLINTSALDLDLENRIWRKTISENEVEMYYYDQLMFRYNPTTGDIIVPAAVTGDMYKADNLSGLTNYATARSNMGLVIGTNIQAFSALLLAMAGLAATSGTIEKTGAATVGVYTVSTAGKALIDDADVAAQRATLELGTAALLNVGTAANNIVQLSASAKLPAVDGSALTNVPLDTGALDTALTSAVGFNNYYESAQMAFTHGTAVEVAHGLGVMPKFVQIDLVCQSAEGGFVEGDRMALAINSDAGGGMASWYNATNIGAVTRNATYGCLANSKTGGNAYFSVTPANWKFLFKAWA